MPIGIGLFGPSVFQFGWEVWQSIILFLPIGILFKALFHWSRSEDSLVYCLFRNFRPIPPGIVQNTDLRQNDFPIVTILIILLNSTLFMIFPENWVLNMMFLPEGDYSIYQAIAAAFVSAFLHADTGHLAGNMLFFWVFGSILENRVGRIRLVFFYLVAIVCSKTFCLLLLLAKAVQIGQMEVFTHFHSLGASGAVSGIMGLFLVRCFFSRVTIGAPLILLPFNLGVFSFLSFPMQFSSPIIIGIFLMIDITGSVRQFGQELVYINYWAHVGGFLGCSLIGLAFGLQREAAHEAQIVMARRYRKNGKSTQALAAYERILSIDPCNIEALRFFFEQYHRSGSSHAEKYFIELVDALSKYSREKMAELIMEYFPKYLKHLPGGTLSQLGFYFFRQSDLLKARVCFELASSEEGPWQPNSLLFLGKTFAAIGNVEMASRIFQQVRTRYPSSPFAIEANEQIGVLNLHI